MRKTSLLLLLLAAVNAYSFPIETAKGQVEISNSTQKIAVFDNGILDNLAALEVSAVAVPGKITHPVLKKIHGNAKQLGSLKEPNFAALAELKPDLVIVGNKSARLYDEAAKIATTLDLSLKPQNFKNTLARLETIAKIVDKEKEAQEIIKRIEKLRDDTAKITAGGGKALVLLVNDDKISAFGKDSRLAWIETELGLKMIEAEVDPNLDPQKSKTHGGTTLVAPEFVANSDADWIFVVDRSAAIANKDAASAQTTLAKAGISNTQASKNGQVVYLSPAEIYVNNGGVLALETTMTEIKEAFENKAKK